MYNAAASKVGPFLDTPLDDHLLEVVVNVTGPLVLSHHFGGQMVERGRGGIILMTSMSSLQGTAIVANYAATKAYDTVLAEGLWSEFRREGVDVLACMAGATATPRYLRETNKPPTDAIGKPMTADDVVKYALADLGSKPRSVPGRRNEALAFLLSRIIGKEKAIRTVSKETTKLYGKR